MASLSGWHLNRDLDRVRVCTCRCLAGRVLGRGDDKDTSSEAPPGFSWKPSHLHSGKGRQVTWGLTDHGEEFGLSCEYWRAQWKVLSKKQT